MRSRLARRPPIRSEPGGPSRRQTTFHPFAQAARHARGTVLRVEPVAPVYETARFAEVPVVDAVATHDPAAEGPEELTVLAVNRHQTEAVELAVDLRAFPGYAPVEHSVLADPDLRATNTLQTPDRMCPRGVDTGPVTGGRFTASLPPVSWNAIRLPGSAG